MIYSFFQIRRNIWQLVPYFHMTIINWSWTGTDVFRFSIVSTSAYYSFYTEVNYKLLFITSVSIRVISDAVTNKFWYCEVTEFLTYRSILYYLCNNPMWVSLEVDNFPPLNHSGTWAPLITWLSHLSLGALQVVDGGKQGEEGPDCSLPCLRSNIYHFSSHSVGKN